MNFRTSTLAELAAWVREEEDPAIAEKKRFFLEASTAMGQNGSIEERLIRLMTWIGVRLKSGPTHTRHRVPLDILSDGAAWCDQQTKVFAFFAWYFLGVECRELGLKHNDGVNGHTVVEAFYEEDWHLFDVHGEHAAVYRRDDDDKILSYDELVTAPEAIEAEDHWWRGKNGIGKAGFYDKNFPPHVGGTFHLCLAYVVLPWEA